MINYDRLKVRHAKRNAVQFGLANELGRDNCGGRGTLAFQMPRQHEQHDPQSPMAANTMSLSRVMLSIKSGAASLEKLPLYGNAPRQTCRLFPSVSPFGHAACGSSNRTLSGRLTVTVLRRAN
jgi:hypothetical protein